MESQKWRFQLIVNPKFQGIMIGFIVFNVLFIFGMYSALFYYFFDNFQLTIAGLGDQLTDPMLAHLANFESRLRIALTLVTIALIIFLVVLTTIFSNKIAGPIYRLAKEISDIADSGEPRHITVRKRDFFLEIPTAFNRLMSKLEEKNK